MPSLTRVLATCAPFAGHLRPMLPLLRELARDAELTVATGPDLCDEVRAEGWQAAAVGSSGAELIAGALRRSGRSELGDPPPEAVAHLYADVRIPECVEPLTDLIAQLRPDVLLVDRYDLAGPFAARLAGVPHVVVSVGHELPAPFARAIDGRAATHLAARRVPHAARQLDDALYLDTCPPSLQEPDFAPPAHTHPMRPEPHRPPGHPAWTPARADRPLVAVTLGTTGTNPPAVRQVLDGLAGVDADTVLTTLHLDPAELGLPRSGVQHAPFIPIADLVTHAAALVTHGGAGSTLAALAAGRPVLALPVGANQPYVARSLVAAGAGLSLAPDRAAPRAFAAAVTRLLADPDLAAGAERIRAEIAAMPGPAIAADAIRQWLATP